MIREILHIAHIIDAFLRKTLGRPYQAILSIALIYEIIHRVHVFLEAAHNSSDFWQLIFVILLGVALVINQLSDLYEHLGTREEQAERKFNRQRRRSNKHPYALDRDVANSFTEQDIHPESQKKEPKN
jgi:hypothetical protein